MNNPSNRDSDNKLIANYWHYELLKKDVDLNELSATRRASRAQG